MLIVLSPRSRFASLRICTRSALKDKAQAFADLHQNLPLIRRTTKRDVACACFWRFLGPHVSIGLVGVLDCSQIKPKPLPGSLRE